jgi:hypothetical protein
MKLLSSIILWIGVFLYALSLSLAFDGDYFWFRVAITIPFTISGVILTQKIYKK